VKIQFRERLNELTNSDCDFEEKLMLYIEQYLSDKFTIEEDNAFPLNDFVFDIKIEVEAWDHDSSPYNKEAI
jgi:hypothetical protein